MNRRINPWIEIYKSQRFDEEQLGEVPMRDDYSLGLSYLDWDKAHKVEDHYDEFDRKLALKQQ